MMWLRKYWSNSKKNSKVSKQKLTSLNPPFLRCLNLYIEPYVPRGHSGRMHTKLTTPGAVQRGGIGIFTLIWCKYSGSPPGGISRTPYIWDTCRKVLFHLEKWKTNLQNVHYLHPTRVVSAPHTSPLPSQGPSHKKLWVETAIFLQVTTWRSPAE